MIPLQYDVVLRFMLKLWHIFQCRRLKDGAAVLMYLNIYSCLSALARESVDLTLCLKSER